MKYDDGVREARTLIKRSEEDQWRLAELTWQHARPRRGREVLPDDVKSIREWAADVGLSEEHVGRLRQVWERFGSVSHRPKMADAYAEVQGMPVDRQERREMEATTRVKSMDTEKQKDLVREIVREMPNEEREDLAYEITSDASRDRQQSYARQVKENQAAQAPIPMERLNWLIRANQNLASAVRDLPRSKVSDEEREAILAEVRTALTHLNQIEAALSGRSIDEELADILGSGK